MPLARPRAALLIAALVFPFCAARPCRAETEAEARPLQGQIDEVLGRPGGLLAEQVVRRAVATSPAVKASQAALAEAVAGVDQALAAYIPRAVLSARYNRLSDITSPLIAIVAAPADPGAVPVGGQLPSGAPLVTRALRFPVLLNQYVVQASLSVPVTDYFLRFLPGHAAAVHREEAARFQKQVSRRGAALAAREAYYLWVRARLQEVVFTQALGQSRGHLADARRLLSAGRVSPADVLRMESQVSGAELLLLRAHDLGELLEDRVRTVMHEPPGTPYEIGEDLRAELPPLDGVADRAALVVEAQERRLEVLALLNGKEALHEQARIARAGAYPRLDLVGELTYANPNQRYLPPQDELHLTWSAGAALTFSPTDVPGAIYAARAVKAREAETAAQVQALRDALRGEVIQTHQAYQETGVALRTADRGLAAAEEAYRVRLALFTNGRASSVELIDAETDLTRARLEALNARVDLRLQRVRLLHAVGRDGDPS